MQTDSYQLRDHAERPAPGPFIPDTNVFIASMSGRASLLLKTFMADRTDFVVAAPTLAELSWVRGRLDPLHPETNTVLQLVDATLAKLEPTRILTPDAEDWSTAGTLAGQVARTLAGGGRKLSTAFDRTELINDALIAILAHRHDHTVITEDRDFAAIAQALPGLRVLFYDRTPT